MTTIDITPTPEGFAAIARRFSEQILTDVKQRRKTDDRVLLVEVMKIAAELGRSKPKRRILARLLVAIEQDEKTVLLMPEPRR